jgi:hypothetical protein
VQALSKYSLLVNQQNLFNLSLEVVDHTLKWHYQNKGFLLEQIVAKSAKVKVNNLLTRKSQQLRE